VAAAVRQVDRIVVDVGVAIPGDRVARLSHQAAPLRGGYALRLGELAELWIVPSATLRGGCATLRTRSGRCSPLHFAPGRLCTRTSLLYHPSAGLSTRFAGRLRTKEPVGQGDWRGPKGRLRAAGQHAAVAVVQYVAGQGAVGIN
jgi:hypothetical protein